MKAATEPPLAVRVPMVPNNKRGTSCLECGCEAFTQVSREQLLVKSTVGQSTHDDRALGCEIKRRRGRLRLSHGYPLLRRAGAGISQRMEHTGLENHVQIVRVLA